MLLLGVQGNLCYHVPLVGGGVRVIQGVGYHIRGWVCSPHKTREKRAVHILLECFLVPNHFPC